MTSEIGSANQGPSAEDIEAALNRTGFLLEHRVAKILRNYQPKPEVTMGYAFPDLESGKSREIDVYAEFYDPVERKPDISIMVTVTLIIECKNNSGPFVLIGDRGQESPCLDDFAAITFDPFAVAFAGAKYHQLAVKAGMYHMTGLPDRTDFVGRQLLRLNRQNGAWKADNSAVYDSILYPLAKARQYEMGFIERERADNADEHWKYPGIRFVLPVIVTSGPIYIADATDDDLKIETAKWVSLKRNFRSRDLNGDFWADIVSFSEWNEYLDAKVMKIFTEAQNMLGKHIHFYDPEWMTANFGEPGARAFFQQWLSYHQGKRSAKK